MWLTSKHMLGSGNFGDKSRSWVFKILKLPEQNSGNLKIFKNAHEQFILNRSPTNVIPNAYYWRLEFWIWVRIVYSMDQSNYQNLDQPVWKLK